MLYKIVSSVPTHRIAYEFIIICLTYVEPTFSQRIIDSVYKLIVVEENSNHIEERQGVSYEVLPYHLNCLLATYN